MRPIIIAGGGLAGLSLGIALRRRGVPVTLHEAGSYPRHRVCGEFLNGLLPETIQDLGIHTVFKDAVRNQSTVWFSKSRKLIQANLPVEVLGLSRWKLDERLAREFEKLGGDLRENSRVSACDGDSEKGIVFAHGRKLIKESPWLGLKMHVRQFQLAADLEMHLGTSCYVGLARIEDDQTNVCGLFQKISDLSAPGGSLLLEYLKQNKLGALASRLEAAETVDGSMLGVSGIAFGKQPESTDPASLALGDQRSMICPFTGNGMASAFQSAAVAAGPLACYSGGETDWRDAVSHVHSLLESRQDGRISLSTSIQPFLIDGWRRKCVEFLAAMHLLPFGLLYRRLQ